MIYTDGSGRHQIRHHNTRLHLELLPPPSPPPLLASTSPHQLQSPACQAPMDKNKQKNTAASGTSGTEGNTTKGNKGPVMVSFI